MGFSRNERIHAQYIRALSLNGLGVELNANGDYSETPALFKVTPAANEHVFLRGMIGHLIDTVFLSSSTYGKMETLTNGINFYYMRDSVQIVLTPQKVKSNDMWMQYAYDYNHQNYGVGNDSFFFNWSFLVNGRPLELRGDHGDELVIELNDNFDGLDIHCFNVFGLVKNI